MPACTIPRLLGSTSQFLRARRLGQVPDFFSCMKQHTIPASYLIKMTWQAVQNERVYDSALCKRIITFAIACLFSTSQHLKAGVAEPRRLCCTAKQASDQSTPHLDGLGGANSYSYGATSAVPCGFECHIAFPLCEAARL